MPAHTRSPAVATFALVALTALACRTGSATARTPTCADADAGTLRITNQSGRMIEIHTWRPEGPRVFIGTASPGTTTLRVSGPSDLDARYGAIDPARGAIFATVSWMRPHARGGSSMVLLDLECVSTR
jgi:hypothetical protein